MGSRLSKHRVRACPYGGLVRCLSNCLLWEPLPACFTDVGKALGDKALEAVILDSSDSDAPLRTDSV